MTGMDAGSPSSGMRRRSGMGPSDRRTGGRADGHSAGPADRQADRQTDRQTNGQTDRQPGEYVGPERRCSGHRPGTRSAHRTAHSARRTAHSARHTRNGRTTRRHPCTGGTDLPAPCPGTRRAPGRGVGPRSHAGTVHGHRGRHPNGPAADTHRSGAGRRVGAEEGCAAADSGIPAAARPAAPGAGGRRAPGHDRRLPRLPAMTLHQPSDRQGASSAPGLPGRAPESTAVPRPRRGAGPGPRRSPPAGAVRGTARAAGRPPSPRRRAPPPRAGTSRVRRGRLRPAHRCASRGPGGRAAAPVGEDAVRAQPTITPAWSAVRPAAGCDGADGLRTVRQHGVVAINFSNEAMQSGQ